MHWSAIGSGGFLGQNRFHFQLTNLRDTVTLEAALILLADAVKERWATTLAARCPVHVKLRDIELTSVMGAEFELTKTYDVVGANVTSQVPGQCALLLSIRSGKSGRRFRNRSYYPGVAISDHDGGVIDTTLANAAAAFMDSIRVLDFSDRLGRQCTWTQGVYSQPLDKDGTVTPAEFNARAGYSVRAQLATQRRRVTV